MMRGSQDDQLRNLVILLIEKHGTRAPSVAQHQALKAKNEGDAGRAELWNQVARLSESVLNRDYDA
jgi:hypothetical protein